MEVYVDDMLVKSKEKGSHLEDLKETFETLRQYKMKSNPRPGLGPGTKFGILSHLLTYIGLHARLWVWSLSMVWERC